MKKISKPIVAIPAMFPAMLIMLVGMRLFGIITIRNTASDFENFRQILKSPEPKLADIIEIYQYQYNLFNLIALLSALIILLIICISIRTGSLKACARSFRKWMKNTHLPNIGNIQRMVSSFIKGIQYGQISDVKRRYRVVMSICGKQQSFLFAADKSEKPAVMDLSCFDSVGTAGEGLVRISIPKTTLIWGRRGVSLISKGMAFSVIGEDRTASRVHVSVGERISVRVGDTTINIVVF